MKETSVYKIQSSYSIRQAIKRLDKSDIGFAACVDENEKVIGVFTDGDFRKAVLCGLDLEAKVEKIINRNFKFVNKAYTKKDIEDIFNNTDVQHIPVIENGRLIDIITEESFRGILANIPVVIMSGGKGSRLYPFSSILPKSLIPIGEKAIIEIIMDEYAKYGTSHFYISINHKGRMIKAFLDDHVSNYKIQYINETKPLGTAGSLRYMSGKFKGPFFVTNCDILIKDYYPTILDFHKEGRYDFTIVGSMQHHMVPYGVCEIKEGGDLKCIREKPQYDFLVNTGMYILEPAIIDYIPDNQSFDMVDLIKVLQEDDKKIGVYPVSEKKWIDIGQWTEYRKAIKCIEGII